MTPLDRAIAICGTQSELARRVTGKPSTGHVYHWRNNGVSEPVAVSIERAVSDAIAESPEAARRAEEHDGPVTVEQLRPDLTWTRNEQGAVVSFTVRISGEAANEEQRGRGTTAGGAIEVPHGAEAQGQGGDVVHALHGGRRMGRDA